VSSEASYLGVVLYWLPVNRLWVADPLGGNQLVFARVCTARDAGTAPSRLVGIRYDGDGRGICGTFPPAAIGGKFFVKNVTRC
jgi:hypothetical protein